MSEIIALNGDIWQVDVEERGIPGWTSAYFLKGSGDNEWMLLETGAASSMNKILTAAAHLGISAAAVKNIGVTHIHVDHAGGLGLLARHFSKAKIWVHPRGLKHLVDPSRLVEGSIAVYGEKKMQDYGEVLPVPRERIHAAGEGTKIFVGERIIDVWETPGHARHHLCFYDRQTRGLFCGDAAGVYAPRLSRLTNLPVTRPATPGPDFNSSLMLQDLYRMFSSNLQILYFTHFGAATPAHLLLELVMGQLYVHRQLARNFAGTENAVEKLGRALQEEIKMGLRHSSTGEINNLTLDNKAANEMRLLLEPLFDSADGLLLDLRNSGEQAF